MPGTLDLNNTEVHFCASCGAPAHQQDERMEELVKVLRDEVAELRTRLLKAHGADEIMADQEDPVEAGEVPRSIEELRRGLD